MSGYYPLPVPPSLQPMSGGIPYGLAPYSVPRGPSGTTMIFGLLVLAIIGYLVYVYWLQPVPKYHPAHRPMAPKSPIRAQPPQSMGPSTVVPFVPGGTAQSPTAPPPNWIQETRRVAPPPSTSPTPTKITPVAVMSAESFSDLLGSLGPSEDEMGESTKMSEDEINRRAAERAALIAQQDAWKSSGASAA